MKKNPVLIVAGGMWQLPLIQFLKDKGHSIHVVDPYDTSPGVPLADVHIQADVRDAPHIHSLIQQYRYDFIVSDQTDIAVDTVAYLNEKMGLPYLPEEVRLRFSDKGVSRKFAQHIGVSIPLHAEVHQVQQVADMLAQVGGAVILKPTDSQSSRGIQYCAPTDSLAELEAKLAECMAATRKSYVLAEQIVEGIEVTCEGFAAAGQHRTLAYSSKRHFSFGIASELRYPAQIPEALMQQIVAENDRYVHQAGLHMGITHAEYIVNPDTGKFWLVEIACRGGGTLISSHIAPWVSGIDLYEEWYRALMGQQPDVRSWQPQMRSALLKFFEFPRGKVVGIDGLEAIRKLPGVLRLDLSFQVGDTLRPAQDDRSRQGFVILLAHQPHQLDDLLGQVEQLLKVQVV